MHPFSHIHSWPERCKTWRGRVIFLLEFLLPFAFLIKRNSKFCLWRKWHTQRDYGKLNLCRLVPLAAPSKAYGCGRWPPEIVGSNPTRAWMSVYCECCMLSGRGLCDELITSPEESNRLWCVVECDLETSWVRRPWPAGAGWGVAVAPNKKNCT
jgi:hypothetical protein